MLKMHKLKHSNVTQIHREHGVTLIELVVVIAIIGISAATIASLISLGFDFNRTNTRYADNIRAAESCYETILAINNNDKWAEDNSGKLFSNACQTAPFASFTATNLSNWIVTDPGFLTQEQRIDLVNACKTGEGALENDPTCEHVDAGRIDNGQTDSISFKIPIQGSRYLELIVPD